MPWVNQVVNVVNGKVIKIDPEQARLSRMRRRIGAWSEFVGLFPVRKEGGGWIVNIPPDRMQFFGWKHSKIEFYSPWIMA